MSVEGTLIRVKQEIRSIVASDLTNDEKMQFLQEINTYLQERGQLLAARMQLEFLEIQTDSETEIVNDDQPLISE